MNKISALIRDPTELLGPLRYERVHSEKRAHPRESGSSDGCLLDIGLYKTVRTGPLLPVSQPPRTEQLRQTVEPQAFLKSI